MKIPQEIRALIESGTLAHFVTLNRDGSPQVTLIWMGLDGDDLVAGHLREHVKVKNIRRDPRVAISLETNTKNSMGLAHGRAGQSEAGKTIKVALPPFIREFQLSSGGVFRGARRYSSRGRYGNSRWRIHRCTNVPNVRVIGSSRMAPPLASPRSSVSSVATSLPAPPREASPSKPRSTPCCYTSVASR